MTTEQPDLPHCDGCDKPRRPYRYAPDGEYEKGLMFCFLCVKEMERQAKRDLRDHPA